MHRRALVAATVIAAAAVLSGCANDTAEPSASGAIVHRRAHDAPGPVMTVAPAAQVFKTVTGTRMKVPSGNGIPNRFTIWRDSYEAKWIGTTTAGDQFFVGPQYDLSQDQSDAYEALFLFAADGAFKSATIIDFGSTSGIASEFDTNVDQSVEAVARSQLLSTLGSFRRTDVFIQPFAVTAYGLQFGFVPSPGSKTDPDDPAAVVLLPANDMEFNAPWTYGHYDT